MTDRADGTTRAIAVPGGPSDATGAEPDGSRGAVIALWQVTLQALADRSAHEIRGALNGVAVNLEVVRMRSDRPGGMGGGDVGRFLGNAVDQLELLTERTEALLAVSRPAQRPFDVRNALRRLVALLGPVAQSAGGAIEIADETDGSPAVSSADPATARLVLAATLLAVGTGERRLLCRIAVRDAIIVGVEGAAGDAPQTPELLRVAADAGIGIEQGPEATIVAFPAQAG